MTSDQFIMKYFKSKVLGNFSEAMLMYHLFGKQKNVNISFINKFHYTVEFSNIEEMNEYISKYNGIKSTEYGQCYYVEFIPRGNNLLDVYLSYK